MRSILHCDMNNFYASVERLFDNSLIGVPVAVCGEEELRHGIVLAKSEEAKRCGVKTGDTVWQAKEKCPSIRIVPTHFERYVKYSRLASAIYKEYTPLVEPFGMDECWLDVTASRLAFGNGVEIGEKIRQRVKRELGLTLSVGVSFNKVFAKLGSDMKKPDALTHIPFEKFQEMTGGLPVEEMLGVGRKTAAVLHRYGIHTLAQLACADEEFLALQFGKTGADLKRCARGEDESPVVPVEAAAPMKSVGHGLTVSRDLTTSEEVWTLILALCQDVGAKLRLYGFQARGIALECKDKRFFHKTLQKQLTAPTDCTITLAKEAFSLFQGRYEFREPLRSVTVRAISLEPAGGVQLSLFQSTEESRALVLDKVTDSLRNRYGKGAVLPARLLTASTPDFHGYIPFRGTEKEPEPN